MTATRPAPDADTPVGSPGRRRVRGVLVLVAVVAALGLGVLVWAAPRRDVALPGPGATPEQVVGAYIDAVDARDFDTANAIDDDGVDLGPLSRPGRTDVTRIYSAPREGRAEHVLVLGEYHGVIGMNDQGLTGYYLRRGQDRRWHIVGMGVA